MTAIASTAKSSTSWWQTVTTSVVAYVLFVPLLLVVGIVPLIYRLWISKWLHLEESEFSLWVSFFQYYITTFLAVFIPTFFLKRADPRIVSLVLGAPLVLLFLVGFVMSGLGKLGPTDSFGMWDMLASTAGVAFGAGTIAYQERRH